MFVIIINFDACSCFGWLNLNNYKIQIDPFKSDNKVGCVL